MFFPSATIPIHIIAVASLFHYNRGEVLGENADEQYCPTIKLKSLVKWRSDLRASSQSARLASVTKACPIDLSKKRVLFLGIDGLRADASAMLPLPNFRRLESIGQSSYWASVQSTGTAVSGPGWASIMTGVEPTKHKVDGNEDLTEISSNYPNFLKQVKDKFSKGVAASVTWSPLIDSIIDHQDPNTLDDSFKASSDTEMAAKAKTWIRDNQYGLIFTHFDACDHAGHVDGFDGYKDTYIKAVTDTDVLLGELLDAVFSRNTEEWLIILTSDHGGFGYRHGDFDRYNRHIPLIVGSNSPRVNIGRAPANDPGSHMDVLPTIMHFFGGKDAIPSGLDGQVFGFRDYTREISLDTCTSDPKKCGCMDELQADYRGDISETESGRTCQSWTSQFPHSHDRTPDNYPDSGLDLNFCRNPDNESKAWCYTTDSETRWDNCGVPECISVKCSDKSSFTVKKKNWTCRKVAAKNKCVKYGEKNCPVTCNKC